MKSNELQGQKKSFSNKKKIDAGVTQTSSQAWFCGLFILLMDYVSRGIDFYNKFKGNTAKSND